MRRDPDWNVLFGLRAIQTGWIDAGSPAAAFRSWTRDGGRSLGELLVERGARRKRTEWVS
jgi:hypothetical protein